MVLTDSEATTGMILTTQGSTSSGLGAHVKPSGTFR